MVTAAACATATATVTLRRRAFQVWDPARRRWVIPAQDLRLHLGQSVDDLRLTVPLSGTGVLADLTRPDA